MVISSQNERTLGGEGGVVLENEQGRARGEGGSKLGNLEQTYFLSVSLGEVQYLLFYF